MTRGTHCPMCGRTDCRRIDGPVCEGLWLSANRAARHGMPRRGWPHTAPRVNDRERRRQHARRLIILSVCALIVLSTWWAVIYYSIEGF